MNRPPVSRLLLIAATVMLCMPSLTRAQSAGSIQTASHPIPSPDDLLVPPIKWWTETVAGQVLDKPQWVKFDLETILLDTLEHSPRIVSVSAATSATVQRVVEQDAAFDSTLLLGGDLGATNDPVGNTLTTGGDPRLQEKSLNLRGGARRLTRRGTELEWSQQIGLLDSNSNFFLPINQGNSRLSLNLTKPLLARGGRYYNERLVTQARIEGRSAWQEMRGEVEQRIADVMVAYWQLYQLRAQLAQQRELLGRSEEIDRLLTSRKDFDAGRIEIAKARQRVARRGDQVIRLEAELKKQQSRLAALIGNDELLAADSQLEFIPTSAPAISPGHMSLRDAVAQALQYRPEVRQATQELQLSALEIRVTKVELQPTLNAVFNGYLAQLNGGSRVAKSFLEQFENAPGVSAGLEYELPIGRRANRSRYRQAMHRYRERQATLQEAIQQTRFDVETALIDLDRYAAQQISKRNVLATAIDEENILTVRWRMIGGDGSRVGVVLETLLDAQQRRTDAEQDLVAVESSYMIALIQLERAMGTLLINEGIQPNQDRCSGDIHFLRTQLSPDSMEPEEIPLPSAEPIQDATLPTPETVRQQPLESPSDAVSLEMSRSDAVDETARAASNAEKPGATFSMDGLVIGEETPAPVVDAPPNTKSMRLPELLPPAQERPAPPTLEDLRIQTEEVSAGGSTRLPPLSHRLRRQTADQLGTLPTGWNAAGPSPWKPKKRLETPDYNAPEIPPATPTARAAGWRLPAEGWQRK